MNKTFLLIVMMLCAVMGCSKDPDSQKYSENAEKNAKRLREEIRSEIKVLGRHDWAGEYYQGDGLGANISFSIAPKSGYVFEWHGCLGLYDRNYGAVTWSSGCLRLSFAFKNKREEFAGIAEEFIPVSWGGRKYLVPSYDMIGFCNKVNSGSEPRESLHGRYLLRVGDEKKKATGYPTVPYKYQIYLLRNPIVTEIIAVGSYTMRSGGCDWKFKDTEVTLDTGKDSGLLSGMELHVIKPDNLMESVTIISVGDKKSEGVMTQIGKDEPSPKVGWKLSTQPHWEMETDVKHPTDESSGQ
ncbi:MAG: hypothetical protein ACYTBP_13210 [Planctomycetota bacterium]|jgi:hypothetical protein